MIEEVGKVVGLAGLEYAWVQADRAKACGSCSSETNCSSRTLTEFFGKNRLKIRALNPIEAKVGDTVVVGLDETRIVSGAFWVYMGPLIGFFVFALLGYFVGNWIFPKLSEGLTAVLGAGGILLGFFIARTKAETPDLDSNYEIEILRLSDR